MSHELTDEKIAELHDAEAEEFSFEAFDYWGAVTQRLFIALARAAYDLGKQAATEDDGFIPCTFEDIQKGDTVERTWDHEGLTNTTTGVVHEYTELAWRNNEGRRIAGPLYTGTYRRKPAPVQLPDPEKHPVILDKADRPYIWDGSGYRLRGQGSPQLPQEFDGPWRPAKIVPEEAS